MFLVFQSLQHVWFRLGAHASFRGLMYCRKHMCTFKASHSNHSGLRNVLCFILKIWFVVEFSFHSQNLVFLRVGFRNIKFFSELLLFLSVGSFETQYRNLESVGNIFWDLSTYFYWLLHCRTLYNTKATYVEQWNFSRGCGAGDNVGLFESARAAIAPECFVNTIWGLGTEESTRKRIRWCAFVPTKAE